MKPGSLGPLSRKAEALLAAERDIVPQPERVRRRAVLRARTALWRERSHVGGGGAGVQLWKRLGLAAAVALLASSAVAAWITLAPGGEAGLEDTSAGAPLPAAPTPTVIPKPRAVEANPAFTGGQGEGAVAPVTKAPPPTPAAEAGQKKRAALPPKAGAQKERARNPDELGLLDRARRAVAGGKHRSALALIDRHARSYPKSEFGEEREALRVRALKGAGLRRQAGEAASDFEARYPKSVLAPQMNRREQTSP